MQILQTDPLRAHIAEQSGGRRAIFVAKNLAPAEAEVLHGAIPGAAPLVAALGHEGADSHAVDQPVAA